LKAVIDHPKALQIEYVMAHDAAVSALGKFLQFHREKLNAAQVYIYFFPIPRSMEKELLCFTKCVHISFYVLCFTKCVHIRKVLSWQLQIDEL
jgi:hypothetical protein